MVEAHGTGTVLGDPIEAQALLATYGQDRPEDRPLWLGSIKSNIGHAQAAAGVAGVIKMVMALRNGVMPRTLHAEERRSTSTGRRAAVELLTEARPWDIEDRPRRAAVSSFGISGTNAHVVIEQGPAEPEPADAVESARCRRGCSPASRPRRCGPGFPARVLGGGRPELDAADVGWSLATGRALLEQRATWSARTARAAGGPAALAEGEPGDVGGESAGRAARLAMLFAGQGSQRVGMGRELASAFPVFAEALDEVCALLPHPVRQVMFSDPDGVLAETGMTQPALFAFEVRAVPAAAPRWVLRRMCWSGTRSGRSPPLMWRVCCRCPTRVPSSPPAPG
ncbi:hypothetical protein [Streptosporangium vulgare]|uniref:hypothetical protein n=1 Tax=Streptosporangium vulgare TaxID=46190 RepID=UPI0031E244E7